MMLYDPTMILLIGIWMNLTEKAHAAESDSGKRIQNCCARLCSERRIVTFVTFMTDGVFGTSMS